MHLMHKGYILIVGEIPKINKIDLPVINTIVTAENKYEIVKQINKLLNKKTT